jgi:glutamine phosphoribosylpyrophosphate amidotransferase
MCGIVGAVARREVSEILLEGLRRLEYRGYDSAGIALVDNERNLLLHKHAGKVAELEKHQQRQPVHGCLGIAHTRWATTANPARSMHTRIPRLTVWPWYTTALLKTMSNCAQNCEKQAVSLFPAPTLNW